ncbi:MAG: hypothetical protein RL479_623 [Verrucomicrobiota bacterium]
MLTLTDAGLRVEVLDPGAAAELPLQGLRFCRGGYVWQVHDERLGPLLSGPEYPAPAPVPFNGQGLPESFRHRTRDGRPLTWRGNEGLAPGIGRLGLDARGEPTLVTPCAWTITQLPGQLVFQTRDAGAGLAYELARQLELRDRTLFSRTQLTNTGAGPLALQWFAHPFWPLRDGEARVRLPAGTRLAENPGFAVDADGTLAFRRPFRTADDQQFTLLELPPARPLTLTLDHPQLPRVEFGASFAPDECPVWANARTLSVEPYLTLDLAPGETRHWELRHAFPAA